MPVTGETVIQQGTPITPGPAPETFRGQPREAPRENGTKTNGENGDATQQPRINNNETPGPAIDGETKDGETNGEGNRA